MPAEAIGSIVRMDFPRRDSNETDRRYAVIIHSYPYGGDFAYLLAMLTSGGASDPVSIDLSEEDFDFGYGTHLPSAVRSRCRPMRLMSAERHFFDTIGAQLSDAAVERIRKEIRDALTEG